MHARSTISPLAPQSDMPRKTQLRVTMLPEGLPTQRHSHAPRMSMSGRRRRTSRASFVPRAPRRGQPRRLGAGLVASLLMTATFVAAPAIFADTGPVVVGEVSTSVGHEEVVPVMRATLTTNLADVKVPAGKKIIISATLSKLETKTEGSQTTTSCVISLALRDAKDGVLKGIVQGNSKMAGASTPKENDALVAAAIRGATKGVSEVASH